MTSQDQSSLVNKENPEKSSSEIPSKNHPCLECSSVFANKSNLNRHVSKYHPSKDATPPKKRIEKEEEKKTKNDQKSSSPK
jgi:hypothetical protein